MARVLHLIDDTTPGGVVRVLDSLKALGHRVEPCRPSASAAPRRAAEIVVSHVVVSWRNLPWVLALRARNPGARLIHVEHSYSAAFYHTEVRAQRRFRALLTLAYGIFDRVVAVSGAQSAWLAHFAGSRLSVVPPCVALDAYLALPEPSGPIRRIGAIGRLHDQKGFDILIPAFLGANLPEVTLEIYGDGGERARLEALAEGHPNVRFHGHCDPVAAMDSVDAVAMPSRREPYGLVALEAMAAGRPLLVSGADGLADHAAAGAIRVDGLTVEDWSKALRALVTGPDRRRTTRARRHAAGAEARFDEGWRALTAA